MGSFLKLFLKDPLPKDDERQDPKRKEGAQYIVLVFTIILEPTLNYL
jgi:hypothetical protein